MNRSSPTIMLQAHARSSTLTLAALAAAFALAGCTYSGPPGRSDGTFGSDTRIPGESRDPAANPVSLLNFADQVSQAISARVSNINEITTRQTKPVIALGNIRNTTRTSSQDFEAIRRRVFVGLVNSNVSRYADMVERVEIIDEQTRRLAPQPSRDLLDERRTEPPQGPRYSPADTYVLQGEFSELIRGGGATSTYIFDATLTHLGSGRIVFAEQYEFKQVR